MKKRDFTSAFENDNNINTGISLDEAVHGLTPKLDTGRIVAKPISIFDIYPDPMQPRRAIPSSVRQGWDGSPAGVERVLVAWHQAVCEERGEWFDLHEHLQAEGDAEDAHRKIGPLEKSFLKVIDIAGSVRREGLTNPITVTEIRARNASGRAEGDRAQYQLETGERRWLAYHLLNAEFPGENWDKIPARVIDTASIWRQASENNARDNLNAIAKARQYALLMMDLWSNDPQSPVQFEPFDAFENEREFYAQIVSKQVNRAPSGKNHLIMSAMGVSSRGSLSFYKRFLTLPDEVWQIGDDYDLPEEFLYRLAKMEPEQAIAEVRKIVLGQNNSQSGKRRSQIMDVEYRPGTKRHLVQSAQIIKDAGHGKDDADEKGLRRIGELRAWLDSEETRILKSRKGR